MVGKEVVKMLCVQKMGKSRHLVRRDKTRYSWHKIFFQVHKNTDHLSTFATDCITVAVIEVWGIQCICSLSVPILHWLCCTEENIGIAKSRSALFKLKLQLRLFS